MSVLPGRAVRLNTSSWRLAATSMVPPAATTTKPTRSSGLRAPASLMMASWIGRLSTAMRTAWGPAIALPGEALAVHPECLGRRPVPDVAALTPVGVPPAGQALAEAEGPKTDQHREEEAAGRMVRPDGVGNAGVDAGGEAVVAVDQAQVLLVAHAI